MEDGPKAPKEEANAFKWEGSLSDWVLMQNFQRCLILYVPDTRAPYNVVSILTVPAQSFIPAVYYLSASRFRYSASIKGGRAPNYEHKLSRSSTPAFSL